MKKGTYNILVAIRCRPLSQKEKEFSDFEILKILDKKMVILIDPYEYNAPADVFKNRSREQRYAFDFAFDKTCDQINVFTNSTKFLIDGVVNGFNATVFAYGPTGAGKTYTMLGTEDEEGIMVLTLKELFDKISFFSSEREYKVKLWYLEIYNENIRDLLTSSLEYLDLREDPTKGISISNISELIVTSCEDIMQLLKKGNKNRTQEATNANETSSRSHAILQVQVEYKDKITGLEVEIKIGKLSLIDLAGSERASATQNRGIRLIEGANINRSLLTLGNCINALCEANEKGTKPYIPYRDSKLTRLLKDSLGGNSRTVMIANLSPSITTFDDTYNTLKYANRAKNIKTQVQRNVMNVQYHISNYNQIINNLKNEITDLKTQLVKKEQNINVNNNISSKIPEIKKDENFKINQNNNYYFEKSVGELKTHCEEEILLKQKIIEQEQEINKMISLLNRKKADMINNSNALINNLRLNTEPNNYEDNNDDRDNVLIQNNSVISNVNITSSEHYKNNIITKETEGKIIQMKKTLEKNIEKFKEMSKKRDQLLNTFIKNGMKDFHYEYMQSIVKAHNLKIFIIENRFKEKCNFALSEVKENYIIVLEDQLKIRDNLIKKQTIGIPFEYSEKMKSLDQIKNEYSLKLPTILNPKIIKDSNLSLDLNYSNISTNNLPPINRLNVNSVLSDIKSVNNMSKFENDAKIKDKSKVKKDYIANLGKMEVGNNKQKFARNYSQGVRNLNIAMNNINKFPNENSPNNQIGNNYISNPLLPNQRIQQNKYISSKYGKRSKIFNLNLINSKKKDNNSENSDSNNVSHEYDSYLIDLDNSGYETQIKKIKQNQRDRKSAQPKSLNHKDDISLSSPFRRDNPKLYLNNKKDDYFGKVEPIPQVKKKDLNVFLNERSKNKNYKKTPFKL